MSSDENRPSVHGDGPEGPPPDPELDALLRSVPMNTAETLPDPGDIVAYHQGRLSAERAAAVEADIAGSAFARDLLAGLAQPVPDALADWAVSAIPHRRRGRRWAVAGLALAAAVALAVLGPNLMRGPVEAPDAYAVTAFEGGRAEVRSEPAADAPRVFAAGDTLRVYVAPTVGDARPATAAALFVVRGGVLRPLPAAVTPMDGAFRVEARADALFEGPGTFDLRVALALGAETLEHVDGAAPGAVDGVRFVPLTVRYVGEGAR